MSNPSLIPTKQEQSEKTKALLDKYDNAYSDPVCIKSEYKKRVAKATLNRKKAKHDYF